MSATRKSKDWNVAGHHIAAPTREAALAEANRLYGNQFVRADVSNDMTPWTEGYEPDPYECPECGEEHEGDITGTEYCPDCQVDRDNAAYDRKRKVVV